MSLAVKFLEARLRGDRYPPDGTEDSEENRALWNKLGDEILEMKARGITPEIPWEYADMDDD